MSRSRKSGENIEVVRSGNVLMAVGDRSKAGEWIRMEIEPLK
jgi:hypothetical protein